ncbi:MAG TPA: hypothetical protein VGA64_04470 [Candidatus Polarisedimenticolia bacterium]
MKRIAALLAVLGLVGISNLPACDKDANTQAKQEAPAQGAEVKQVAMTGFLTDSYCGSANASQKGKDCAAHCVKKGAKIQLYSNDKLYTLDKVENLDTHLGVEVKVTGTLDEASNTIKVTSIENVTKA